MIDKKTRPLSLTKKTTVPSNIQEVSTCSLVVTHNKTI